VLAEADEGEPGLITIEYVSREAAFDHERAHQVGDDFAGLTRNGGTPCSWTY